MARRKRSGSARLVILATGLALLSQGLVAAPWTGASTARADVRTQVDPPSDEQIVAEPLTDADRLTPPVPIDPNGVIDPEFTELDPGAGKTVSGILGDEIPVPEDGGADYDAFSPAEDVGTHFLALYPEVVNTEQPDGDWVEFEDELVETPDGWQVESASRTVRFPAKLGPATPLVLETPAGSLTAVPTGVDGAAGEAQPDGVVYADAAGTTDFVYAATASGYKETAILEEAPDEAVLGWDLTLQGLGLTTAADGSVQITSATGPIGQMPPVVVSDSAPTPAISTGTYVVEDGGDGTARLSIEFDPAWLETATYPVYVDPGASIPQVDSDTYVKSDQPSANFGNNNPLVTGPWTGTGTKYRSFIRFGTGWHDDDMVVYSAVLHIKNTTEAAAAQTVQVARATWNWNNAMTWNSMMAEPGEGVSSTPFIPDGDGATGAWWTMGMAKLYQGFTDNTWADQGVRLTSGSSKKFNSVDASGTANDPWMQISYDTRPNPAPAKAPTQGKEYEKKGGITLSIDNIPNDPDGDEVLVRYQVSADQGVWGCGTGPQRCSAWTNEESFDVPADWLADGGTYHWRVQSADVCTQPDTLCDMTKPDGTTLGWNTSAERDFTIRLRNWGSDERYAMWSQDAGSGMSLNVNEANGNLFLEAPIETLRTPIGRLRIGLSYNSQAAAENLDRGLSDGWRLWAGPESSGLRIPTELEELSPAPYGGVRITFRSGGRETYGWRSARTYAQVGSGSGVVRKNPDGTWTYRGPDGDVFKFDAAGLMTKARPVASKPKAAAAANPNY